MKKLFLLLSLFVMSFASETAKLLPNRIDPHTEHINTTWGLILFFIWPILIFGAYKFIEFTLRKTGEDI